MKKTIKIFELYCDFVGPSPSREEAGDAAFEAWLTQARNHWPYMQANVTSDEPLYPDDADVDAAGGKSLVATVVHKAVRVRCPCGAKTRQRPRGAIQLDIPIQEFPQ